MCIRGYVEILTPTLESFQANGDSVITVKKCSKKKNSGNKTHQQSNRETNFFSTSHKKFYFYCGVIHKEDTKRNYM